MSHATHKPDDDLKACALKLMDEAAKRREEYLKRFEPPMELKIVEERYARTCSCQPQVNISWFHRNASIFYPLDMPESMLGLWSRHQKEGRP